MTTSTSLSGAQFPPKPPDRGSFPLDHLSECRRFAQAYRKCLQVHDQQSAACRPEARAYLQCRMQRGLMAQDDWETLGLSRDDIGGSSASGSDENASGSGVGDEGQGQQQKAGFVAGMKKAKLRKQPNGRPDEGKRRSSSAD